jgi:hypothetical protein
VKSAFEGDDWIARIAMNPAVELKRKRDNRTINEGKNQKQMFATMMKRRVPDLNFKDLTRTLHASNPLAPIGAPGSGACSPAATSHSSSSSFSSSLLAAPPSSTVSSTLASSATTAVRQSSESIAASLADLQMGQHVGSDERPSKRLKAEASSAEEIEAGDALDPSLVLDPDSMKVPHPIRDCHLEVYCPDDTDEAGGSSSDWA